MLKVWTDAADDNGFHADIGGSHPATIGGLRIVGPDVVHPNFIHWDKDSVSCG